MTYEQIKKMEKILNQQLATIATLQADLATLKDQQSSYEELVAYYGSKQWFADVEADQQNKLPQTLQRGVLSEDGVYNVMCERYQLGLTMLEHALQLLKQD